MTEIDKTDALMALGDFAREVRDFLNNFDTPIDYKDEQAFSNAVQKMYEQTKSIVMDPAHALGIVNTDIMCRSLWVGNEGVETKTVSYGIRHKRDVHVMLPVSDVRTPGNHEYTFDNPSHHFMLAVRHVRNQTRKVMYHSNNPESQKPQKWLNAGENEWVPRIP